MRFAAPKATQRYAVVATLVALRVLVLDAHAVFACFVRSSARARCMIWSMNVLETQWVRESVVQRAPWKEARGQRLDRDHTVVAALVGRARRRLEVWQRQSARGMHTCHRDWRTYECVEQVVCDMVSGACL